MSLGGQTIFDRLNSAKYTLAGQALARCICKATTEELLKPKKKHLDYLVACTYEPNVSLPQLANLLIDRTTNSNWVVVYKALITLHHLMNHGSDKLTQYLASSSYNFQKENFLDRSENKGYTMSPYIRSYSIYINKRALAYRTLAIDLCKVSPREKDIYESMTVDGVLKSISATHDLLETLLNFSINQDIASNGIVKASLVLLLRDAIRLFAIYNQGVARIFEQYLDLDKKTCRTAYEQYKKFLTITDRVEEFLRMAETINLDKTDIPNFKKAPSSLLDAFEQHVINLESGKTMKNDDSSHGNELSRHHASKKSTNLFETQEKAEYAYVENQNTFTNNDKKLIPTTNDLISLDD